MGFSTKKVAQKTTENQAQAHLPTEQKDGKKQNNLNSKTFKMKKTGLISKRSPDQQKKTSFNKLNSRIILRC